MPIASSVRVPRFFAGVGVGPFHLRVFASVLSVSGALLRTVLRWAALCVARAVGHGLS